MMTTPKKMPKGVTSLYCIQAFSTFSYAVLYASLSLYLTKQLGLSTTISNSVVGLFLAFNYVLHLFGGILGGRFLSNRALFLITSIIQSLGIIGLALAQVQLLYLALSLFLIGCGLNTTYFNTLLTQRFEADDSRRDQAFFINYAAMNVGFVAGYIISGFYDYTNDYHQLFWLSLITNSMTLLFLLASWSHLADKLPIACNLRAQRLNHMLGILMMLLFIPILLVGFHWATISNLLVVLTSVVMFFVILSLARKQSHDNQQKLYAYLIFAVTSVIFWMIYFTGPMGVTLFIKNNVDKTLFSYSIATQWLSNINPLVIIFGSPLMAYLFARLQAKGIQLSLSLQFGWAFLILSLSFFSLSFAIMTANATGFSSIYWIIIHFITQALAELLIGPVGYAMIGRLVPAPLQGLLMGAWMMISGVAAALSHYFSNAMVKTPSTNPLITNHDYLSVFNQLGFWALAGALFLIVFASRIQRLITSMQDNHFMADSEQMA